MMSGHLIRSFLYVPGDRADRVAKAFATGADAVLIDLEDAVAPSSRPAARDAVLDVVRSRRVGGPELWIRINAGDTGRMDLDALTTEADGIDGLVLAKCDDARWLDEVASSMPAHIALSPLIESAAAVRRLDMLCGHPRVSQCHLGEIDLLADLGARSGVADGLIGYARAELVYASAAAGIQPPVGGVHADVSDLVALAEDSARLADMGFAGRPALHPAQVPVINTAFMPSAEEIAAAVHLVTAYDEAVRRGVGALRDGGRMVDEAVVRRARKLAGAGAEPATTQRDAE